MTSTTAVGAGTVVEPAERRLSPIPGIPAETSIADALRLMSQTRARYLPVHAKGRFVGLVSERDLLSALAFELATSQDPVCALALASTPTRQSPASLEEMAAAMHAYDSDVLVMCTGVAPTSLITAMDLLALVFPAATAAGRRGHALTSEPTSRDKE